MSRRELWFATPSAWRSVYAGVATVWTGSSAHIGEVQCYLTARLDAAYDSTAGAAPTSGQTSERSHPCSAVSLVCGESSLHPLSRLHSPWFRPPLRSRAAAEVPSRSEGPIRQISRRRGPFSLILCHSGPASLGLHRPLTSSRPGVQSAEPCRHRRISHGPFPGLDDGWAAKPGSAGAVRSKAAVETGLAPGRASPDCLGPYPRRSAAPGSPPAHLGRKASTSLTETFTAPRSVARDPASACRAGPAPPPVPSRAKVCRASPVAG